jgi:hypothetical protein
MILFDLESEKKRSITLEKNNSKAQDNYRILSNSIANQNKSLIILPGIIKIRIKI